MGLPVYLTFLMNFLTSGYKTWSMYCQGAIRIVSQYCCEQHDLKSQGKGLNSDRIPFSASLLFSGHCDHAQPLAKQTNLMTGGSRAKKKHDEAKNIAMSHDIFRCRWRRSRDLDGWKHEARQEDAQMWKRWEAVRNTSAPARPFKG